MSKPDHERMPALSPEERAQRVFNDLCNDPEVWATHGMPGADKEDRIVRRIAQEIAEAATAAG